MTHVGKDLYTGVRQSSGRVGDRGNVSAHNRHSTAYLRDVDLLWGTLADGVLHVQIAIALGVHHQVGVREREVQLTIVPVVVRSTLVGKVGGSVSGKGAIAAAEGDVVRGILRCPIGCRDRAISDETGDVGAEGCLHTPRQRSALDGAVACSRCSAGAGGDEG